MAAKTERPAGDTARAKKRLKRTLLGILLMISLPMALIVARTYSQLDSEGRYLNQRAAEEVLAQFDHQLLAILQPEDERPFEDYQFFQSSGSGPLRLSPLAQPGARLSFPGMVGYFQVGPGGQITSPLLPEDQGDSTLASFGISGAELDRRREAVKSLRELVGNASLNPQESARKESEASWQAASSDKAVAAYSKKKDSLLPSQANVAQRNLEERAPRKSMVSLVESQSAAEGSSSRAATGMGNANVPGAGFGRASGTSGGAASVAAAAPQMQAKAKAARSDSFSAASDIALQSDEPPAAPAAAMESAAPLGDIGGSNLRQKKLSITRFSAEIDPFQAAVLPSGNLIFFRRVWRDEKPYVQGFVAQTDPVIRALASASFFTSALASASALEVRQGTNLVGSFEPSGSGEESVYSKSSPKGVLAEFARFSVAPPLNQLQLVFTGGRVERSASGLMLHLLTLTVFLVLLGGFWGVYRLSVAQIDLAEERSDFVSSVSHELKTPLTSIRMYAEMLKSGMAAGKQETYYDFILSESERLSRLIANVLQIAKLSRGIPLAAPKTHQAGALLELVRKKTESQVKAAGFELKLITDPDTAKLEVIADEDSFTQILINLIDNALKFSAQAPERCVELGLKVEPGPEKHLAFTVRDYGPGVPKEERKKIFQLFYRSESELTRKTSGTGIGLALVARLAASMGGAVDLRSLEPKGSEFRVIFPIA